MGATAYPGKIKDDTKKKSTKKEVTSLTFAFVARALIQKYHPKSYNDKWYIWGTEDDKIGFRSAGGEAGYVQIDEKQFRNVIHDYYYHLRAFYKTKGELKYAVTNEILHFLEAKELIVPAKIDPNLYYVKNGTLNWHTGEVYENDPEYFIPIKIPARFDPKATSPTIDNFFNDITLDTNNGAKKGDNEAEILTLEEQIAYALDPSYFIKKGFMHLGPTHSGKTTFMNLAISFLGKENVSFMSLYDLKDQFFLPDFQGKIANLGDDIGYDKLPYRAMGLFNVLAGGIEEKTVRKIRGNTFGLTPRAKLSYSANQMPSIKTHSQVAVAFIGRWVVNLYPNQFPTNDELPIKLKKELSGLLNKVLEAKLRYRHNKEFTITKCGQRYAELEDMFLAEEDTDVRAIDKKTDTTFRKPTFGNHQMNT